MSEHDYVIANDTGANVRADLNLAFLAIQSQNSKSSAPSTTYAYMFWADTANDLLKQRNAANNAWINILTLSTGAVTKKGGDIASASPTVIDTDGDYFICTGTTNFSAFTVAADRHFFLEFAAALTMTHGNGTLDLPGGANITTAASDVGEFVSTAANVVTCVNYTKRDGTAVVVASSDLSGDSSPQLGGFLDANGNYIQMQKGGDISSASPTVIDTDGDFFAVTGTTNFSAFTVAADRHFFLEFGGALTMTHGNGTLDLPGGANITTAASDVGEFVSTAANVVTCVNYTKRDGTAVVAGGLSAKVGIFYMDQATATGTQAVTGVGFQPVAVIFFGNQNVSTAFETSWGLDDGSLGKCIATYQPSGAGIFSSVGASFAGYQAGSDHMYGDIDSLDSDGFTVQFTKTGSPSGLFGVAYLALK